MTWTTFRLVQRLSRLARNGNFSKFFSFKIVLPGTGRVKIDLSLTLQILYKCTSHSGRTPPPLAYTVKKIKLT